jgi:hypothetical protein
MLNAPDGTFKAGTAFSIRVTENNLIGSYSLEIAR